GFKTKSRLRGVRTTPQAALCREPKSYRQVTFGDLNSIQKSPREGAVSPGGLGPRGMNHRPLAGGDYYESGVRKRTDWPSSISVCWGGLFCAPAINRDRFVSPIDN